MSYILDALRRADAERQRGQPPALQQVASAPMLAAPAPPPALLRRLAPGLLLALAAAGATGVWMMLRAPTDAAPAGILPPQALASMPAAVPSAPASAALPRALAAASVAAAAPPPPSPPVPPARVQAAAPAPSASAAAPPPAAPSAPAPAPDTSPRAIVASALPEPQRSAVARLGIGGAVHSPEPGRSFVMVGGQIVREGATLAPGITLERIEPRLLQLRVGEQRVLWPL